MRRIEISSEARIEIKEIAAFSHENFGSVGVARYAKLIQEAIRVVARSPESRSARTIAPGLRIFHLKHLGGSQGVKTPRHIIVYRFSADRLEVLHVFHDAMDLPARLSVL